SELGFERCEPCAVRIANRFELLPQAFQLFPDLLRIRRGAGVTGAACCAQTGAVMTTALTAAIETTRLIVGVRKTTKTSSPDGRGRVNGPHRRGRLPPVELSGNVVRLPRAGRGRRSGGQS